MPHQCVHCGEIFPDASPELLSGCSCGSKFFYYIKQEKLDDLNRINDLEIENTLTQLNKADKEQIERDIRDITGMRDEPEKPVILDLESIRVISPGKFEIDLVNLFSKKRPIIYRLEKGKYIIDLTSTYKTDNEEIKKKIRNPKNYYKKIEKKSIENKDILEKKQDITENKIESKIVEKNEENNKEIVENKEDKNKEDNDISVLK
ncbi:MAG: Zn-ribbon containing protein [Candidatus Pacearchaeota archaeon]